MTISARGRYSDLDVYFASNRTGDETVEAVAYSPPGVTTSTTGQTNVLVTTTLTTQTTIYRWSEGDRIDTLAFRIYGDSRHFWRIMDMNPTLLDPTGIEPGALLTVPRV